MPILVLVRFQKKLGLGTYVYQDSETIEVTLLSLYHFEQRVIPPFLGPTIISMDRTTASGRNDGELRRRSQMRFS
jgi:hypothetical protein